MTRTLSIFHNPCCSKSRTALAYLEENKDKYDYLVQINLYQKETITRDQLTQLVDYLGLDKKEASWKILLRPEAQKLVSSWDEAFDLLVEEPKYLERPFVVDFEQKKAALGRPDLTDVEALVRD